MDMGIDLWKYTTFKWPENNMQQWPYPPEKYDELNPAALSGKSNTELLYTTDMNITEIAYEVGFNGTSYYAEAFRKCFGITPSDYRKKSKGIS